MLTVTAFAHFVDGLRAIQGPYPADRVHRDLPTRLRGDAAWDELPPIRRCPRR